MGRIAIVTLKIVIGIALAGSLVVQGIVVPLLWLDVQGGPRWLPAMVAILAIAGVVCLQIIGVCIWRLLTRVRAGTVFAPASFREVHVVIIAIAVGAVIIATLAVGLAITNRVTQDDLVAPGLVGLLLGLALVAAGVALLVYVMRELLVQAIALDADARGLRAELDEVI